MQLEDWLLTHHRAALHLPTATAVVADLHLGYAQARQRSGEAVPNSGAGECLLQLQGLALEYDVRRLVVAGDLFEDGRHGSSAADFLHGLAGLRIDLIGVVPGNHDRDFPKVGPALPIFSAGVNLGQWRVLHGDGPMPRMPVIHGHFHPCLRLNDRIAARCFLVSKNRIVLPAFSGDAAGVNVLGQQRWQAYRCFVITGRKVLDFGTLAKSRLWLSEVAKLQAANSNRP